MLEIIQPAPADGMTTVIAEQSAPYVTLRHGAAELTLHAGERPGNHTETIYLADGALGYMPGEPPVIAAVFACHAGRRTLTLYPLPAAAQPE